MKNLGNRIKVLDSDLMEWYTNNMKQESALGIGSLVKIKNTTHDESIPQNRLGVIVGYSNSYQQYPDLLVKEDTIQCVVKMSNGKILHFHQMFLTAVVENVILVEEEKEA